MSTTYGTLSNGQQNSRGPNGLLDPADQERAALLSKTDNDHTLPRRFARHMRGNISKTWGDLALLLCYVITGLLDSSSVQVWGSFVSMQTGNTIYVGLGLAAPQDSTRWIRSLISVACFCFGSMFFAFYHRTLGPRRRWVMVTSWTVQVILMLGAALIVTLGPTTGKEEGEVTIWICLPLALIAFQSGGQAVTSRVLSYGGLTSVVLTSIYCDLFSDQKLFTSGLRENPERNRRAVAPVMLLIGAVGGGLWAHSAVGLAGALWTAIALKGGVTVAWLLWAAEVEQS